MTELASSHIYSKIYNAFCERNTEEFLQIWHKHSLKLKNEQIRVPGNHTTVTVDGELSLFLWVLFLSYEMSLSTLAHFQFLDKTIWFRLNTI